jgi:hypothetical protein
VRSSFVMNQLCCQTGMAVSTGMPGLAPATRENRPVRTTLRRLLGLGILAGAGYALFRVLSARSVASPGAAWEAQPFPFPPQPVVDTTSPWVEAAENGTCPAHHPVKANLTSGIFHVPGGANYARTQADRCYVSADAAEADGLRASKR